MRNRWTISISELARRRGEKRGEGELVHGSGGGGGGGGTARARLKKKKQGRK